MRTREGRMIGAGSLAGGSERRSEAEILRRIRKRPRRRISLLILVGLAIAGLSALYLFADSLGALWRAETGLQEKASELAETRQALALAHREIDTASRDRSAALADLAAVTQAKGSNRRLSCSSAKEPSVLSETLHGHTMSLRCLG